VTPPAAQWHCNPLSALGLLVNKTETGWTCAERDVFPTPGVRLGGLDRDAGLVSVQGEVRGGCKSHNSECAGFGEAENGLAMDLLALLSSGCQGWSGEALPTQMVAGKSHHLTFETC
jgi:hypothetical protein